ncbi:MAG TPA: DUF177 domain-containing protein [Stellaceae bacterium]|nr:DUF177 domain-containing protein [Stellaceae bacterium]
MDERRPAPPQSPRPEFSRIVSVAHLGEGDEVHRLAADAAERAALARRFGLLALERFEVEARLSRERGGGVRLAAQIAAELVQECVVSLEPVAGLIAEEFTLFYRPGASDRHEVVEAEAEEVEPLVGDEVDIGEAAAQQLSLAIDPFPRAPGAHLPAPPEDTGAALPHPFAALERLRRRR